MAIALGSADSGGDEVIPSINTTPLVDVMLVLLIIFLITSPVVIKTVPIKLPSERNLVLKTKPENITLAIGKDGAIFWNQAPIANAGVLLSKLKEIAVQIPQPELHIRGDQQTRYENIGKAIFAAQRAGIAKVSFITEPSVRGR